MNIKLLLISITSLLCVHLMAQDVVTVYETVENTELRLSQTSELNFVEADQALENEISIFVIPAKKFQTFVGIGGAITDASAEVFALLSEAKQKELLDAYYSEEGNNYNIIRTSIHSCDFGSASFTYIEEGDKELKTFSIAHDQHYRLPLIKKAIETMNHAPVFYASPWSPPAFMKINNNMLKGGKILPEYMQAWANYYVKFIEAYEAEGIPVWGLTVQNEPMAVQRWESCIYTAEEERDFIKNNLGPTLVKAGLGDVKLIAWDHNRDLLSQRASVILEDKEAAKYVWGMGFHWYETWAGGEPMWNNLKQVNESYPDKKLVFTEGCNEGFKAEHYQRWSNAERYGRSMINDFNNGTVAWTDWNILLNEKGGPNHVSNMCFAPIHADTHTGELIFTPSYYYIGHFSKFIQPEAKRVSTTTSRSSLIATSFENADGKIVTVVMNGTEEEIDYKLIVAKRGVSLSIAPRAIQTLCY